MKKVIITVVGKDTVGIIARVSAYLAKNGVNILDIAQTVVGGYFNMMMVADASKYTKSFERLGAALDRIGAEMGLKIRCQKYRGYYCVDREAADPSPAQEHVHDRFSGDQYHKQDRYRRPEDLTESVSRFLGRFLQSFLFVTG